MGYIYSKKLELMDSLSLFLTKEKYVKVQVYLVTKRPSVSRSSTRSRSSGDPEPRQEM